MVSNKTNLVPLYSRKSRKIFIWLTGFAVLVSLLNFAKSIHFAETNKLLWGVTILLAALNFSKLGGDRSRDQLARYLTLKITLSYLIGFLLATSFIEIFFNSQMLSVKLFAALSSNIIFLVSHYVLYHLVLNNQTELDDEGYRTFIQTQKPLIIAAAILSIVTLLVIMLVL